MNTATRQRDIFLKAAANAKPPFRRIYFDTEPLTYGRWPWVTKQLGYAMGLGAMMRIELCVPEAVLWEREEQFVREMVEGLSVAKAKTNSIEKMLRPYGITATFHGPEMNEIRDRYRIVQQEALDRYSINQIPCAERPLSEILRQALRRGLTFEDKADGVVGLQDCVILLSVFDDLKARNAAAALVSNDGIFGRIPEITPEGTDLVHVRGLTALTEMLDKAHADAFSPEYRQWLKEQENAIRGLLNRNSSNILDFLAKNISQDQVEGLFSGAVLKLEAAVIEQFGTIRPELDGLATDPIPFSCDVMVRYTAFVEFLSSLANILAGIPPGEPGPPLRHFEYRSVTVELEATTNPDHSDLVLKSARLPG